MATFWLDLVRYADSIGYHSDTNMDVYLFREWVINAFNSNLKYDQFTREQIAGDLLPNSTDEQKVASGYNRLLQTTEEGGAQPKEYVAIYAADRVRNVSSAWLGGTLGCAQCHDHKYDPYTAKDFYSMAAFFADIKEKACFFFNISKESSHGIEVLRRIRIVLVVVTLGTSKCTTKPC